MLDWAGEGEVWSGRGDSPTLGGKGDVPRSRYRLLADAIER